MEFESDHERLGQVSGEFLSRLFYQYMLNPHPPAIPSPWVVPAITLVERIDPSYVHPKFRIVVSGHDYVLEKEPQGGSGGEIFRVHLSGQVVFEQEIAVPSNDLDAKRQLGQVRVFAQGPWSSPLRHILDALDSSQRILPIREEDHPSKPIPEEDLRQVNPRTGPFWFFLIGGILANWLGGFLRYRHRYSPFSETVAYEAMLFLLISVGIAGIAGRKDWRYAIVVFFYASLGVGGFFSIGAP
jgi:hypothetical protein